MESSLSRFREHVVLTADVILRNQGGEITEWPIAAMKSFRLSRNGSKLRNDISRRGHGQDATIPIHGGR